MRNEYKITPLVADRAEDRLQALSVSPQSVDGPSSGVHF